MPETFPKNRNIPKSIVNPNRNQFSWQLIGGSSCTSITAWVFQDLARGRCRDRQVTRLSPSLVRMLVVSVKTKINCYEHPLQRTCIYCPSGNCAMTSSSVAMGPSGGSSRILLQMHSFKQTKVKFEFQCSRDVCA
jgi:hypothetical protein